MNSVIRMIVEKEKYEYVQPTLKFNNKLVTSIFNLYLNAPEYLFAY